MADLSRPNNACFFEPASRGRKAEEMTIEVDEISRVVGVIRVPRSATTPVGEGLRQTFGN
jgi:hypothetical protein